MAFIIHPGPSKSIVNGKHDSGCTVRHELDNVILAVSTLSINNDILHVTCGLATVALF